MMRNSKSYGNVLASQSGWESDTFLFDGMGLWGAIRTRRTQVDDAGGFPLQKHGYREAVSPYPIRGLRNKLISNSLEPK